MWTVRSGPTLEASTERMIPILCWKSVRPQENRHRYYCLSVEPDLWGRLGVVSRWGRLWSGQSMERISYCKTRAELSALVTATHVNRLRHGYDLTSGELQLFSV